MATYNVSVTFRVLGGYTPQVGGLGALGKATIITPVVIRNSIALNLIDIKGY